MIRGSAIQVMERPSILEWLAWRRYLTATGASDARTYAFSEEAAWERLQADLASIGSSLPLEGSTVVEMAAVGAHEDPRREIGVVPRGRTSRRRSGLLRRLLHHSLGRRGLTQPHHPIAG